MPPNPHQEDDECHCELCQEAQAIHDPGPLEDAVWTWRERLDLFMWDDVAERLGQEAELWLVTR